MQSACLPKSPPSPPQHPALATLGSGFSSIPMPVVSLSLTVAPSRLNLLFQFISSALISCLSSQMYLSKQTFSAFPSTWVGGGKSHPHDAFPEPGLQCFALIEASAHTEWRLVTVIQLNVCLNILGAVILPTWPSSNSSEEHRDRYLRYDTDKGDGTWHIVTLSCCWDTCCFASGASQPGTVTISNPDVLMYLWEGVNTVRVGYCPPN